MTVVYLLPPYAAAGLPVADAGDTIFQKPSHCLHFFVTDSFRFRLNAVEPATRHNQEQRKFPVAIDILDHTG